MHIEYCLIIAITYNKDLYLKDNSQYYNIIT